MEISIRITSDNRPPYSTKTSGFANISFYNAVLGKLLKLTETLEVKPDLLKIAYWDFKKLSFIIELRDDLVFHNGRKATIDDLYFSIARFFYTTARADQISILKLIEGTDNIEPDDDYKPWAINGIKKIDSYTMELKLKAPSPKFLYALSDGWISLVPKEELKEDLITWKRFPIGAGPYKVIESSNSRTRLQRTKAKQGKPHFFTFVSDKNTPVDITGFGNPPDKNMIEIVGNSALGFIGIFFNKYNPLSNILDFRKAISLAIDKAHFTKISKTYTPLHELLTSNFQQRLNNVGQKDKASPKKIISSLIDKNIIPKKFKIAGFSARNSSKGSEKLIETEILNQLKEIGLSPEIVEIDSPTFEKGVNDDIVLRVDKRGTAFRDPQIIFNAFSKGAFLSPFMVSDSYEYEKLLTATVKKIDSKRKTSNFDILSKYFLKNYIIVPIVETKSVFYFNPSKVKNIKIKNNVTFDIDDIILHK